MDSRLEIEHPVILFDGVCNLCNASVNFIIDRDREKYRFASLQSKAAQEMVKDQILNLDDLESILLVENGQVFARSDAALRIASNLTGFWPLLKIFLIFPRSFRDFIYSIIARNRYRWFGKTNSCKMPQPHHTKRFLDY